MSAQELLYLSRLRRQGRLKPNTPEYARYMELRAGQYHQPEPAPLGMGEAALVGAGRGILDITQGAKELAMRGLGVDTERYRQGVNEDLAAYAQAEQQYPITTGVGRTVGMAGMASPVAFAGGLLAPSVRTMTGAALEGMGIGATEGLLAYQPSGEMGDRLRSGGFGALGGAGGGVAGRLASNRFPGPPASAGPRLPVTATGGGAATTPAATAGGAAGVGASRTPTFGIPLTRGQQKAAEAPPGARMNPEQLVEKRIIEGMEGEGPANMAQEFLGAQQGAIDETFEIATGGRGGFEDTGHAAGKLTEEAKLQANRDWDRVNELYERARDLGGVVPIEDADAIIGAIEQGAMLDDNIRSILQQGDIGAKNYPKTADIMGLARTFFDTARPGPPVAGVDLGGFEQLRRSISDTLLGADVSPADARNLRQIRSFLDRKLEDVGESGRLRGPDDGVAALKDAIRARAAYAKKYGENRVQRRSGRYVQDRVGRAMEDLAEGDLDQGEVEELIFGSAGTPVRKGITGGLYRRIVENFGEDSPQAAAFKGLLFNRLREQASGEDGVISPRKLVTAWEKLTSNRGDPLFVDQIFSAAEREMLDTAVREIKMAQFDPRAGNPSGTANRIEAMLTRRMLQAGTTGGGLGFASGGLEGAIAGATVASVVPTLWRRLQEGFRAQRGFQSPRSRNFPVVGGAIGGAGIQQLGLEEYMQPEE